MRSSPSGSGRCCTSAVIVLDKKRPLFFSNSTLHSLAGAFEKRGSFLMSAGMLEFGSWWLSFGSRTLIPGTRKKSGLSSDTIESVIVVQTRGEVGADKNRSLIAQ
jgi:hypothetical protein